MTKTITGEKIIKIQDEVHEQAIEKRKEEEKAIKNNVEIARAKGEKFLIKFIAERLGEYEGYAMYAQASKDALVRAYGNCLDTEDHYRELCEHAHDWNNNLNHARTMRQLLSETLEKLN